MWVFCLFFSFFFFKLSINCQGPDSLGLHELGDDPLPTWLQSICVIQETVSSVAWWGSWSLQAHLCVVSLWNNTSGAQSMSCLCFLILCIGFFVNYFKWMKATFSIFSIRWVVVDFKKQLICKFKFSSAHLICLKLKPNHGHFSWDHFIVVRPFLAIAT